MKWHMSFCEPQKHKTMFLWSLNSCHIECLGCFLFWEYHYLLRRTCQHVHDCFNSGTVCLIPVITTCLRSLDQRILSREWGQLYTRRGDKLYTPTAEFQAHDGMVMERKFTHDNTSDQIGSSKTFVWKSRKTYVSIHSRVSSTTHIPKKIQKTKKSLRWYLSVHQYHIYLKQVQSIVIKIIPHWIQCILGICTNSALGSKYYVGRWFYFVAVVVVVVVVVILVSVVVSVVVTVVVVNF